MLLRANNTLYLANPDEWDKYLGDVTMYILLKEALCFLVFYTPQGGTELSDRVLVVRY